MLLENIRDKSLEYYFVYYFEGYGPGGNDLALFSDPDDAESFVNGKKKDDDDFSINCIIRGKLIDIKPTQVETCWKIQE